MNYVKIELEEYLKTKALADLNKDAIEAVVKETLDNTIKSIKKDVSQAFHAKNETKSLALRIDIATLERRQRHKELLKEKPLY